MTVDEQNAASVQLTRQDIQSSISCYNDLLKVSGKYYRKMLELSQAESEFAAALDAMGNSKASGTGLKKTSELHRAISKQQELLAETIHKDFEVSLQRNLITHTKRVDENEKVFERSMRRIQEEISKTEVKMMKGRKKDIAIFQQSLVDMQRQAQEMEQIKHENTEKMLLDEQKNFMFMVQKSAGVVKNQFDHFSTLSSMAREATEEIISIAFAPPGKVLDAAEKKRVFDTFLGGASSIGQLENGAASNSRSSSSFESESRRLSVVTSSVSSQIHSSNSFSGKILSNGGVISQLSTIQHDTSRPPTPIFSPSTSAHAIINSTPAVESLPTHPLNPDGATAENSLASAWSNASMQESIKKLNLATVQAQMLPKHADDASMVFSDARNDSASFSTAASSPRPNHDASGSNEVSDAFKAKLLSDSNHDPTDITKIQGGNGVRTELRLPPKKNLVSAVHDFTARSDRELSFKKDDVLLIKQSQDNWLYASHYPPLSNSQPQKSGWVPVSYTTPFVHLA